MTAPPLWPPGGQDASYQPGSPGPQGAAAGFRNLLGIMGFATAASPGSPVGPPRVSGMNVDPLAVTMQFTVGPLTAMVEIARGDVQQRAASAGKRLGRRHYMVGPVTPDNVAGYGGLSRIVCAKKWRNRPAGQPLVQMYAIVGPYALTLTLPQTSAGLERSLGQVNLFPPAPPVITPIVRISGASASAVKEKVTITRDWAKLTALVSAGTVNQSTDEFAMASLNTMRSQLRDLAVDQWQPDVFLGGQPCVRDTFLRGGMNRDAVRSEYWWAGVVNGRGIQLFVSATKSIISFDEARPLSDVVVLLPPD
jgi:hypothetical protein